MELAQKVEYKNKGLDHNKSQKYAWVNEEAKDVFGADKVNMGPIT